MNPTPNNSKLSVTADDVSISACAFGVNDLLASIRYTVAGLTEGLQDVTRELKRVSDLGTKLDKIGGAMPYNLAASFEGVNPLDKEVSDEGFVSALGKIARSNKDPAVAALAFGTLAKKIVGEMNQVQHRIDILSERTRIEKRGAEFENAKRMKATARAALAVLEKRLAVTLDRFFKSRNKSITAITRITTAVAALFPNGSTIAREAALRNSCDEINTFKFYDERLSFGEAHSGRKTVRI